MPDMNVVLVRAPGDSAQQCPFDDPKSVHNLSEPIDEMIIRQSNDDSAIGSEQPGHLVQQFLRIVHVFQDFGADDPVEAGDG